MADGSAPKPVTTRPTAASRARTICLVVLALLVITGLVVLITWLVIRPKKLVFAIDKASIHEYNLINSKLNSTFHLTIRVYNPNRRVSVYYDDIQVFVQYDGQVVASEVMRPFLQGHKNTTQIRPEAVARNVDLGPSNEHRLKWDRTGGSVDLDVRVRGKIRLRVGRWKSRHYKLKVLCSPVVIFSDPKKFIPVTCEVDT